MFTKSYCEHNNIGYCDRKLREIVGIVFVRTVLKLNRICCTEQVAGGGEMTKRKYDKQQHAVIFYLKKQNKKLFFMHRLYK